MSELPGGMAVLDRLRSERQIADDQYQRVLAEARHRGVRAEDALISTSALTETALLKWLANYYQTQFVSTEKLARASIDRRLLRLVPRQLALRLKVCPLLYKKGSDTLAVIAADPHVQDVTNQVRIASGVREVKVLVARPAAVDALIAKHYDGDARAFVPLVGERAARPPGRATSTGAYSALDTGAFSTVDTTSIPLDDLGGGFDDFGSFGTSGGGRNATGHAGRTSVGSGAGGLGSDFDIPRVDAPASPPRLPPAPFTIEAPEVMAGLESLGSSGSSGTMEAAIGRAPSVPPEALTAERDAYLDMLHVLVTLLERDRNELKDHSAEVARLTRGLCDRLGVRGDVRHGIVAAAYLHDIGKSGNYHLTSLNVSRYEGHKLQAQKSYKTPGRLFEGTSVPTVTLDTLDHLYERWDGDGFPDRLSGTDIPLGARIIALAETFADLTSHAKNPYRRMLAPAEAVQAIGGFAETVFDPSLCRLLRELAIGDLEKKLLADRRTVLLVDPEPDETTVLDIRLSSAGLEVRVARDAHEALTLIDETTIDAIVAEVDLPGPSGFDLLRKMESLGKTCPVLFLTNRGDRESVNAGFELGAADFLVKPASPEVVVAKVRQVLARGGGRGIRGSLSEMALADVVQVLGNGRKSGKLLVRAGGRTGELLFREGHIWDARVGDLRGEEAVYDLMRAEAGEFSLDPTALVSTRLIEAPTETLLLEAMRRIDEGVS